MFHVRGRPPAAGQVDGGGGGVCACQRDGTVTLHQKKRTSEILPKKVGVGGNVYNYKQATQTVVFERKHDPEKWCSCESHLFKNGARTTPTPLLISLQMFTYNQ